MVLCPAGSSPTAPSVKATALDIAFKGLPNVPLVAGLTAGSDHILTVRWPFPATLPCLLMSSCIFQEGLWLLTWRSLPLHPSRCSPAVASLPLWLLGRLCCHTGLWSFAHSSVSLLFKCCCWHDLAALIFESPKPCMAPAHRPPWLAHSKRSFFHAGVRGRVNK